MRRILANSAAAAFGLTMVIGGTPTAGADEDIPGCGGDQQTELNWALAHEQHDPRSQAPWSDIPVQSNFDSCADVSGMVITIDNPKPNSPRQGFLFHRGRFIGTTQQMSRPFTTIDMAVSSPETVVFVFTSGRTCATCNDGMTFPVHYHWNGAQVVMVETPPPAQDWPTA